MLVFGYIRRIEICLINDIPMDIYNLCFLFYHVNKLMNVFTSTETHKIYRSFKSFDRYNTGYLRQIELLQMECLQWNPMLPGWFEVSTGFKDGLLSFHRFLYILAIFCADPDDSFVNEERLKFLFKMYDLNNDGYISDGDLWSMLKSMIGDGLNDVQIQQMVDRSILQIDSDKDGKLSYQEFKVFIQNSQFEKSRKIVEKLTMDLSAKDRY